MGGLQISHFAKIRTYNVVIISIDPPRPPPKIKTRNVLNAVLSFEKWGDKKHKKDDL
jgi:hypothetical protein